MGRSYDAIPDHLTGWMEAQPMFFVATAPLAGDGLVNVSPKGGDTFRVLDANRVAYLDLTGSGAETIAHLRENGRLTVMFCSFDEKPNIVRLYGTGRTVLPGDPAAAGWPGFDELVGRFPENPGARAVIVLDVTRVGSSCGYAVPFMELAGPRTRLDEWAGGRSPEDLDAYRAEKNATSLDGLPALADRA